MKKRLYEISSLEVLLSFFVILIHILSEGINGYIPGSVLSFCAHFLSRSLTFVVPAFIVISATKFSYNFNPESFSYFKFLKSRIIKIYFPYLFAILIYYLYFVYHRNYFSFSFTDMLYHMGFGTIAAPFYFVVIIMQFYILAPISIWLYNNMNSKLYIASAFLFSVLAMYILRYIKFEDRMFFKYTVFWFIGILFGQNYKKIVSWSFFHKYKIIILGIILTLFYSILSYLEFYYKAQSFITEVIKLFFSISASVMWFTLIPKKIYSVLKPISPATYYLYLWHCLCIFEMQHILDKLGFFSITLRLVVTAPFTFLISILLTTSYARSKLKLKNLISRYI